MISPAPVGFLYRADQAAAQPGPPAAFVNDQVADVTLCRLPYRVKPSWMKSPIACSSSVTRLMAASFICFFSPVLPGPLPGFHPSYHIMTSRETRVLRQKSLDAGSVS